MKHAEFAKLFALALAGALTMTSGVAVAQQVPPIDYGDLIKLYRDDSGVPYLTADSCWQPLPSADCSSDCELVPGVGGASPPDVIPVDPATCGVVGTCATCTQEVDFGRVNEARSSAAVFDAQLQDVLVNLATSACEVSLDPAGRLVTGSVVGVDPGTGDPVYAMSAIDSPLQNLAIYRQLILTGDLGVPLPAGSELLQTAARGLGVANDKGGAVDVDKAVYLNQIMGLDQVPTILDPKICILQKQEVQGTVQLVQKCFLDYAGFGYLRADNFIALPDPPYIPESGPLPGTFEYLYTADGTNFTIAEGLITTVVFADDPGFTDGNIGGFAQAADDTRAVINYMHSWPVPAEYETPMPCTPVVGVTYDLAISDVSGLQVPKNIVDGSEGREFFVNVVNNGPGVATASVTVTAIPECVDCTVEGSPWVYPFTIGMGETFSQTEFFTVDLGQRTTINWTATVDGAYDVNPSNNTVYATSSVRTTGGGGGGGGGRP